MSTTQEAKPPWFRPHISFSEWGNFREGCKHRWYLDYVMGMRLGDRSVHLEFGTAIHSAVELLLSPKLEERLGLDDSIAAFRLKFNDACEELTNIGKLAYGPFHEKKQAGWHPLDMADAGEKILRDLVNLPEIAEAEVVKIEYPLYEDLGRTDEPIKFKGFIDIMLKIKNKRGQSTLLLCDFKTCQWGWAKEKKEDELTLAQPRLYKHFICKKTGMDPKLVRTHFFLLKKKPRPRDSAAESLKVSSSENDLRNTIQALQTDITRMRQGPPYEKNRDRCNAFGTLCPHYNTEACPGEVDFVALKKAKK